MPGADLLYRIAGLVLASPVPLADAESADGSADIRLRVGEVPDALPNTMRRGAMWEASDSDFLQVLPGIGRVHALGGVELVLDPQASLDSLLPFALDSGLTALLHQRGAMVLRGAALADESGALALCGLPVSGKSTLAAALERRGMGFISEERVTLDGNGIAPSGRHWRLPPPSIAALGLEAGEAVREGGRKYLVRPARYAAPAPLRAIYRITLAAAPAPAIRPVPAEAAALALLQLAPHAVLIDPAGLILPARALAERVPLFDFTLPLGFDSLGEAAAALHVHWRGLA